MFSPTAPSGAPWGIHRPNVCVHQSCIHRHVYICAYILYISTHRYIHTWLSSKHTECATKLHPRQTRNTKQRQGEYNSDRALHIVYKFCIHIPSLIYVSFLSCIQLYVLFCPHDIWWTFRPLTCGSTPNRLSSGLGTNVVFLTVLIKEVILNHTRYIMGNEYNMCRRVPQAWVASKSDILPDL